jgi:hypothetical protein
MHGNLQEANGVDANRTSERGRINPNLKRYAKFGSCATGWYNLIETEGCDHLSTTTNVKQLTSVIFGPTPVTYLKKNIISGRGDELQSTSELCSKYPFAHLLSSLNQVCSPCRPPSQLAIFLLRARGHKLTSFHPNRQQRSQTCVLQARCLAISVGLKSKMAQQILRCV